MLYFLLIIIAIGVLLASEAGKKLLRVLLMITAVAGGAYLGFWIIVILWGLFSDKEIRDNILSVSGLIVLYGGCIIFGGYIVNLIYKKKEKGELTVRFLKKRIKNWFVKERRVKSITIIVLLVIIIVSWVIIPILLS